MSSWIMTLSLATRNLLRNKRRSMAILLTIAAGTSALFLFDGFNTGIMNQYRENTIHARYGHGQLNTKGYRDQVFESPWEHWIESPKALLEDIAKLPEVTHVFPRIEFYGLLTNGNISLSGRGQGVEGVAEADFFNTLNIVEGKPLTNEPDGVVLGIGLARSLNAKVGDRITLLTNTVHGSINGADLTVTGIFHTGAKEFDDVVFRLPLTVAQTVLDTQAVEKIAIGLSDLEAWEPVTAAVLSQYPNLEATPFAVLDKVYYQHAVDWLGSQFQVIRVIILLIVILGIFNTVSTSILERKQEVGNLRANGESKTQVFLLFVCEGLLIGALGAMVGLIITALGNATLLADGLLMPPSPGITRQFRVLIELRLLGGLEALWLCLICALVGTFLAAGHVVRMPLGAALRST